MNTLRHARRTKLRKGDILITEHTHSLVIYILRYTCSKQFRLCRRNITLPNLSFEFAYKVHRLFRRPNVALSLDMPARPARGRFHSNWKLRMTEIDGTSIKSSEVTDWTFQEGETYDTELPHCYRIQSPSLLLLLFFFFFCFFATSIFTF